MRAGILALVLALCAPSQAPSGQAPAQPAAPAQPPPATSVADDPVPAVTPPAWPGTFAEGFAKMRELAEKQQLESARTVADALLAPNSFLRWKLDLAERGGWRKGIVDAIDPVLDLAGWNGLDPDARAEVWYAKGVIASLDKDREAADAAFWKARGMSSDVTLQRDAIYDLGVLALQAGEEERAKLPEVSGKPPQPAMPMPTLPGQPPGGPPGGGLPGGGLAGGGLAGATPPPDPLQLARAAYLQARDHFVERLRSEWQHAATQANVELCLKRLRELDEIEKKRKEEEQKKKDQQKKDQQQDQQKQDKQDQKNDKTDEEKQDEEKKDASEPKEDEKKAEEKPPEPKPEEAEKKDEKKDAQPTESKDDQMSQAEITQLLDRLQRLEEEWKKLQAQMQAARRGKVKKDW